MTGPLEALLALVYGVVSALVPVVNAEAYALVLAGRTHPTLAVGVVLALAAGQTVGKLALFEAARRGSGRLERRFANRREGRAARWADRIRDSLRSRRTGLPMVLASAALGVPPLAAVSLAAGAAGQRRWEFGALCLVGRTARFALLVLPAVWAFS